MSSNFVGIIPLLELKILEIQFSTLLSYMLTHIELEFCINFLFMNFSSSDCHNLELCLSYAPFGYPVLHNNNFLVHALRLSLSF